MSERDVTLEGHAVRDTQPTYKAAPAELTLDDVPPGYKRTEVGIIPEEWHVNRLDEIGTFSKGQGVRRDQASSGDIPCIRYGEIYTAYNNVARTYISKISREVANTSKLIRYGDILFAGSGETRQEIGKAIAFVGNEEAYAGGDIVILSPRVGNPEFLGFLLNAPLVVRQKSSKGQGDAVVHISANALSSVLIPYPPEKEQRAIATALSDTDELIESLDRLIAKKRAIKQAAMQQLLTGETRLPGFTGEWETKRLGHVGGIVTGGTPPTKYKSYWDGHLPWITPTDISSKRDIFETDRQITASGLKIIGELTPGSVLITCIASIGKNAILKRKGGCNQQINAIIPTQDNSSEFLYYLIENNSSRLLEYAGTTATSILSKANFSKLEFIFPSADEQAAISTVLSDMDNEIAALERRRDKARQIKQGMMQQLLTGRVRLMMLKAA